MILNGSSQRPWIVVIGGFLGAGKTCLIHAAAQHLQQRGMRAVAILNDQGEELVDTRMTWQYGFVAREVTGGCFCCRYSALLSAIEEAHALEPDVIFAEPVGSCTDISATVLNPLREELHRYRLAPYTVLIDPDRYRELLRADADQDMAYLFHNQVREADLICYSKSDLYPEITEIAGTAARQLSSRTGQGVTEWLDEILSGTLETGRTTLVIDYARYAQAEASLAWMNASFVFEPQSPLSTAQVVGPLLDVLDDALSKADIGIVHLKIFDSTSQGWLKAALCKNHEEPQIEGDLIGSPASRHELLLNLRAKGEPMLVQQIMASHIRELKGDVSGLRIHCFSPAPPQPERRIQRAPSL